MYHDKGDRIYIKELDDHVYHDKGDRNSNSIRPILLSRIPVDVKHSSYMLTQCWSTVCDAGIILNQNEENSCLHIFVVLMLVQCRIGLRWPSFKNLLGYINRLAINMINDTMSHIPLLQGPMLSPPQCCFKGTCPGLKS